MLEVLVFNRSYHLKVSYYHLEKIQIFWDAVISRYSLSLGILVSTSCVGLQDTCMKLSSGETCHAAQNWLTTTNFLKKSKMTGRKICSHKHHWKLGFVGGSLILLWNWSAFWGLLACWIGPWICPGNMLLKPIATISSKNNVVPPELYSWVLLIIFYRDFYRYVLSHLIPFCHVIKAGSMV